MSNATAKKKLKRNIFCSRRKRDARGGRACSGFSSNWTDTDAKCLNCRQYMENIPQEDN